MHSTRPATSSPAASQAPATIGHVGHASAGDHDGAAFGTPFWLTYCANSLMMMAISMLFRYGDFVKVLGGSDVHLGWIVGAGMVGSLLMRVAQGVGIDTYGPRRIWLVSSVLFIISCLAHLALVHFDTAPIYLLRIAFQTSVAGFFGASITFISGRSPVAWMAEVIGTLGTSGFVGMIVGTALGDVLTGGGILDRPRVDRLFVGAGLLGAVSLVLSWHATRGQEPPGRRRQASILWLLRRYHAGWILVVAVAMGIGLGLPGVFLVRYAATLEIHHIAIFFSTYAPTAFITRLAIRRFPARHGIRPMIISGLASLALGLSLFLVVHAQWQLAFPAVFIGIAHAFLFPSVVAGGTGAFPTRYRGLGTTVMLAMFDLGNLIGSPAAGELLDFSARHGLPPYPTMFASMAALMGCTAVAYAWASAGSQSDCESIA